MSDRDYGINYLRFWWNATPMAVLGFESFSDAVAYYDGKNPNFLASFGNIAKGIDENRVKAQLEAIARQDGTTYPLYSEFLQALVTISGQVTAGDIGQAAAQGVTQAAKTIGGVALAGIGTYALIFGGIFLFTFLADRKAAL